MYVHHQELSSKYGCPNFYNKSRAIYQAQAFCWCGLDAFASLSPPTNYSNGLLELADAAEANEEHTLVLDGGTSAVAEGDETDNTDLRALLNKRADEDARLGNGNPPGTPDKACHNKKDGGKLKHQGKTAVQAITKACAIECTNVEGCNVSTGAACVHAMVDVSDKCSECFGIFIHCSDDNCIEECTCGSSKVCDDCNNAHCKPQFDQCSGLKGHDTSFLLGAEMNLALSSTDEGELLLVA